MIRLTVVLICSIIGIGAAVRSRFGGLLFYVWFAVFRPQEWIWISLTASRPSLVVGLLLVVPCLATGKYLKLSRNC